LKKIKRRFKSKITKMNVTCELTKEASNAFEKVKQTPNCAAILRCNKEKRDVELEELFLVSDVSQISSKLKDREPRFILYHFQLKKDDQHKEIASTTSFLWIHWSPSSEVSKTRMYGATKERLRGLFEACEVQGQGAGPRDHPQEEEAR